MAKAANRLGRMAPLSLRTTPSLRAQLDEAASLNGVSLTAEIETRLQQSFDREAWLNDLRRVIRSELAGDVDLRDGSR